MPVTTMTEMWSRLDAYTLTPDGQERQVNHLNEWGGFSRQLRMPIFTGWSDLTAYDKETKTTSALVSNTEWSSAVGVNNQERWLSFAEKQNEGIAAFFIIHALDVDAVPRKVKYIDDGRVFIGKVIRIGTKTYIVGQPRLL